MKASEPESLCLRCRKEPISYMTLPCRHKTLCTGCAARVATGGKCCVCHTFFQRLKHLPKPDEEEEDEDTEEEEEDEDGQGQEQGQGDGEDDDTFQQ